jgi:hypothetical protein
VVSWSACAVLCVGVTEAAAELRTPPGSGTLAADAVAAAGVLHVQPTLRNDRNRVRALVHRQQLRRPRGLVPLYLSFATLQALDTHTTLRGVRRGHAEANPVMAPVAGDPALLIGAKTAAAVGTLAVSERLWRRHRTAAIVLMVAVNAAHAAVVAHNYRQLRR